MFIVFYLLYLISVNGEMGILVYLAILPLIALEITSNFL